MANQLRDEMVLPQDLLIIPVTELSDEVRSKLGDDGEEFAITRPRAREPSKLIDAAAAHLIEQFREPKTIVQAVMSYSRLYAADPEQTLEESLPLLRQLLGSGLLLPAGAAGAERIEETYATGAEIGRFRVVRCIQLLEDSELYQARDPDGGFVAMKIARSESIEPMRQRLAGEATILEQLSGASSPRLLDRGVHDGRPYLALQWISGIDAVSVSAERREQGDRQGLLALLIEVTEAYVAIHGHGVLHGDVHPGNLLVDGNGRVTLIDFGLAQAGPASGGMPRGGVGFFMEPEHANALLERRRPPPLTPDGEQFAVAALLYMLATGQHYMDFTLQQEEMLRQICAARPVPFAERGLDAWPALEGVLARALAVDPAARYREMRALAEALREIAKPPAVPAIRAADGAEALLGGMLDHLRLDGDLYRNGLGPGPLCSVNFGAGGIAYGLYRLACRRDDPKLLAAADAWIAKAQGQLEADAAFFNPAMDMTEATIGRVSPFHARPGVALVQALIAGANGESALRDTAAQSYLQGVDGSCLERDLTLGRGGTVLGSILLLESLPDIDSPLRQSVRRQAEQQLDALWAEATAFDRLEHSRHWPNLGIAHGWAGLLYVTLRLHALTGAALPAALEERLEQWLQTARPLGRGVVWPWRQAADDPDHASMPGWCNGSAGMVHLACLGHRLLGDDRLIDMAEAAAWHAWEAGEGPVDLCCGYAGRAYALLELHRHGGDPEWRHRALALAERAVRAAPQQRTAEHPRHSLYKGELGLALLIADLDQPQVAAMPMFAPEDRS